MAKIQDFTDDYGERYPASYWRIEGRYLEKNGGRLLFYGYPSEAQKGKRIIGQKDYALSGEEYQEWFGVGPLDEVNSAKQAYLYADQKLDKDSGEKGENGQPILVSFFDSATDKI